MIARSRSVRSPSLRSSCPPRSLRSCSWVQVVAPGSAGLRSPRPATGAGSIRCSSSKPTPASVERAMAPDLHTPALLEGRTAPMATTGPTPNAPAARSSYAMARSMRMEAGDDVVATDSDTDELGMTHARFQQQRRRRAGVGRRAHRALRRRRRAGARQRPLRAGARRRCRTPAHHRRPGARARRRSARAPRIRRSIPTRFTTGAPKL